MGKEEMSIIRLRRKEQANNRDMQSTHCSFLHLSSCPLKPGYKIERQTAKTCLQMRRCLLMLCNSHPINTGGANLGALSLGSAHTLFQVKAAAQILLAG